MKGFPARCSTTGGRAEGGAGKLSHSSEVLDRNDCGLEYDSTGLVMIFGKYESSESEGRLNDPEEACISRAKSILVASPNERPCFGDVGLFGSETAIPIFG